MRRTHVILLAAALGPMLGGWNCRPPVGATRPSGRVAKKLPAIYVQGFFEGPGRGEARRPVGVHQQERDHGR